MILLNSEKQCMYMYRGRRMVGGEGGGGGRVAAAAAG